MRGLIPLLRGCLDYIIYIGVLSLVLLQVEHFARFASYGPLLIQVILIFFISRVVVEISYLVIDESFARKPDLAAKERQRRMTLAPVMKSAMKYAVYFVAAIIILKAFQFDILPVLAGAGLLGLVIGLGAQNLINDLVSGMLILVENLYLIGDFIETETAEGVVEAIDIRTTRIRDTTGRLHILRNGQISGIINYSKGYVCAVVDVGVAYDSDLDKVYRVLAETGLALRRECPDVIEDPVVQGLEQFGESELTLRVVARVKPGRHRPVARLFRKRIKEAFDREQIEIPFARRVVLFGKENLHKLRDTLNAGVPPERET